MRITHLARLRKCKNNFRKNKTKQKLTIIQMRKKRIINLIRIKTLKKTLEAYGLVLHSIRLSSEENMADTKNITNAVLQTSRFDTFSKL